MWLDDIDANVFNPYDKKFNYYMSIEHIARYLYAKDLVQTLHCSKVLDASCGNGYGTEIISSVADFVYGIDMRKRLLTSAIKNSQMRNLQNIDYSYCNLMCAKLHLPEDNFDLIVCYEILALLKNQVEVLKAFYNKLNPNGYLLLAVPNYLYQDNKDIKGHRNTYSKQSIIDLLQQLNYNIISINGQSLSKYLSEKENVLINHFNLNSIDVKSYYSYNRESLKYFARLLAYPSEHSVDSSSYFLVLAKR